MRLCTKNDFKSYKAHQNNFLDDFWSLVGHDSDGELSNDLPWDDGLGAGLAESTLVKKKNQEISLTESYVQNTGKLQP